MQLDSSSFVADPELLRVLLTRATPVPCLADRVLLHQDDPPIGVYILLRGAATLQMDTHDGHPIFTIEAQPGSVLGLPGLVSDQPYSLTATARAGADVRFVSRTDFFAIVQADPTLSLKMLQLLAAEVRTARKALL